MSLLLLGDITRFRSESYHHTAPRLCITEKVYDDANFRVKNMKLKTSGHDSGNMTELQVTIF